MSRNEAIEVSYRINRIGFRCIMLMGLVTFIFIYGREFVDLVSISNDNYTITGYIEDIEFHQNRLGFGSWQMRVLLKEEGKTSSYYLSIFDVKSLKSKSYKFVGQYSEDKPIVLLKNAEYNAVYPKGRLRNALIRIGIILILCIVILGLYLTFLIIKLYKKFYPKSNKSKKDDIYTLYCQNQDSKIIELGKYDKTTILHNIELKCHEDDIVNEKYICYGVSNSNKLIEIFFYGGEYLIRFSDNDKEYEKNISCFSSFVKNVRSLLLS